MEFKDYYAALQVDAGATAEEIKRSYRKLARQFHPDVSKEPDAEARFKDIAEAYRALKDPEKRAAYDAVAQRYREGERGDLPPGWDSGFEFRGRGPANGAAHHDSDDLSDFFASLFGRGQRGGRGEPGGGYGEPDAGGGDRHAKITIDLEDAYRGARRTVTLQVPRTNAQGQVTLHERHLEINIPRGMRTGQSLRLAGQGDPGTGQHGAGDLYLEIELRPHRTYRVDGRDVYFDLPVAPWETALGAEVTAPTPDGPVQLRVPPESAPGRTLRLKGRGVPGTPAGDLYARLVLALPHADTDRARDAYSTLSRAFPDFAPRSAMEA